MAKANFPSRIVFQLPRKQVYLATGIEGQQPEKLGGEGAASPSPGDQGFEPVS